MEKYKILGNIGEGAHGIVYKAKNRQTGCLCALKKVALRKIEQQGFPVKVFREIKVLQHIRDVGEKVEQIENTDSRDSKYMKSGKKLSQIKITSGTNGQKSTKPSKILKAGENDKAPTVSDLFLTSGGNYIIFLQESFSHGTGFILSFDYMISDLSEVIRSHPTSLTIPETKSYMIQITRGLQFIHKSQFLHRDLKPSNILISNKGQIKIGDFGLARIFSDQQQDKFELKYKSGDKKYRKLDLLQYSHQVATRWYRAPELLFGAKEYDRGIDVWALGTIFAELFTRSPIFNADTDIEQICYVTKVLGTQPDLNNWPEKRNLPDINKISFSESEAEDWKIILPDVICPEKARNLVTEILVYSSSKRPSCDEILDSEFLNSLPLAVHWQALPITLKNDKNSKHKFLNGLPYENEEFAVNSDIVIESFEDIDDFVELF